ncbi:MAG: DUF924 domain-containing protein [Myxococcales bacterium]|nr:DUF924 domain-containing protein [Myxococcales bacterium]
MTTDPEALLDFWFEDCDRDAERLAEAVRRWFAPNPELDRAIRERYGDLPQRAAEGALDAWQQAPRPALARVIVLDQFPRNLHRGSADAFAWDGLAKRASEQAIAAGFDAALTPIEATFLYLPFEHAEDLASQDRCVALYEALAARARPDLAAKFDEFTGYARRHREVIARFGRFPHRNAALGREPTDAERAYLAEGGEDFSGSHVEQAS